MSFALKRPHRQSNEEGFSLVELAIVLVIIGLIIGGVLKGQDLIHSARVNAVQTTVDKVATAVNTFQGKYLGLPGDLVDQSVVNGTLPTTGGNGNGVIDGSGATSVVSAGSAYETLLFWADLGYAGMLDGISGAKIYPSGATTYTYDGTDALQAAVGGYFSVLTSGTVSNSTSNSTWLQIGITDGTNNDGAVLSPIDATSIDKKFDDGNPLGGSIRGINDKSSTTYGNTTCLSSATATTYNTGTTGTVCALQFAIN